MVTITAVAPSFAPFAADAKLVLSGFFGPGPIMPSMHCGVEGSSLDQPKQLSPARTSVVTDDEADEEPWLIATLRSLWSQTTKSELLTRLRTEFAIFTCVSEGDISPPPVHQGWPLDAPPQQPRRQGQCLSPPCIPTLSPDRNGGRNYDCSASKTTTPKTKNGSNTRRSIRRTPPMPSHPLVIDGVPMDPASAANPEFHRCPISLRHRTCTFSPLARKAMMQAATQALVTQRDFNMIGRQR